MPNSLTERIIQQISDLAPWAYTYKDRPDDLLEVRVAELEAIVDEQVHGLLDALKAYMVPAGATPDELYAQGKAALEGKCTWSNGLWCEKPVAADVLANHEQGQ